MQRYIKCCSCQSNLPEESFSYDRSVSRGRRYRCKKCEKPIGATWRRTNHGKACKADWKRTECGKAYMKQANRFATVSGKDAAHAAIKRAVRSGKIVKPGGCTRCGVHGRIEAHHESYAKENWLKIVWLCTQCHNNHHRGLAELAASSERNE